MENQKRYELIEKQVEYRKHTDFVYYYLSNIPPEKKYCPVDINNIRLKLNKETGEIRNYYKKEVQQSIEQSKNLSKRLLHMLAEMNDFDWFLTLTFDKNRIDRYNNQSVTECYKKFIDNIQKQFPNIKYITVPENHEDEGREIKAIHFHLMVAGVNWQDFGLVYSGKVCCHWAIKKKFICSEEYFEKTKHLHELKETDGLKIYNVTKFAYGLTTATRIVNRQACNFYVTKYLDKAIGCTDIFQKRFYYSKNLKVPGIVKRTVGADFEKPIDLTQVAEIFNSQVYQNSENKFYKKEYNILGCRIDNNLKQILESGAVPTETATPFD